jgi:uncharacterized protein (TIGR00369 family)
VLPVTLEEIQAFNAENVPFSAMMNITCESIDNGSAIGRFAYDARWTRPVDFIAGPVQMALADVTFYWALFTKIGIVPLAVTNELKYNFLRPAVGGDMLCRAQVLTVGRRVAYGVADVYMDGEPDRLVGHATTSYVLPD